MKAAASASPALVVAVSSRALFDFEEENQKFKTTDDEAYVEMQRGRLDKAAAPGVAFSLVKKLLAFNGKEELVRVVVMSRNDPVTGLRVFRSVAEHGLKIEQGCFTRGAPPYDYLKSLGADLFLSALDEDVKKALDAGVPAAHVIGGKTREQKNDGILRIAFDGDAVLFGDQSERVFQEKGLDAFLAQEEKMKNEPLLPGPLQPFFTALVALQKKLGKDRKKIRTALVTARGAPAHERPIRTLMKWGVEVDEAFFMNGGRKQDMIKKFRADFFFDDTVKHVGDLPQGGHVPSGVKNKRKE